MTRTPDEIRQHIDQLEAHINAGGQTGAQNITDLIAIIRERLEYEADLERRFRNSRTALRGAYRSKTPPALQDDLEGRN